ncbi:MAG: hypothetical protein KJN63_02310 [Acidimicrobiia bacterium]|nr:hypothetical protein [Acidimicrobiia bacterium]
MNRLIALLAVGALLVAACGSDDGGASEAASGGANDSGQSDDEGAAAPSGDVVNQQEPGEAYVSVDGLEFTLTESGSLDCVINPDVLTFAFWIGDNTTTLGGGANLYDDGWLGDIMLRVVNEDGLPVQYYPDEGGLDSYLAFNGDSVSYSGPMLMKPPNDGTNPPAESVGDGTISVTCG